MSWLNRFPEYAELPDRQQWELRQAARKRLRNHPREWLVLAGRWSLAVLLGVALTQAPRLFSQPSMLITTLFWVIGVLVSVFLAEYFYDQRLRRMICEVLAQPARHDHESDQADRK